MSAKWRVEWRQGREVFFDPKGAAYVRATGGWVPDVEVPMPRGLYPLRLRKFKLEQWERKQRKQQPLPRKRGKQRPRGARRKP